VEILGKHFSKNHSYEYDKVESPIEQILLNHLMKYLSDETEVIVQLPIKTISGNFRADIALKNNDRIVILECDGEEFHTKEINKWYDEWRDTLILFQRRAETIYRIKGTDIHNNINSIIYLIYKYEPEFFNAKYGERLPEKEIDDEWGKKRINYTFTNDDGQEITSSINVKRKNLESDFDRFWLKYVLYSLINPEKDIKQLIELMTEKHYETNKLISMLNQKFPEFKIEDIKLLLSIKE
jgi:very-short-patch-repair endonuclease